MSTLPPLLSSYRTMQKSGMGNFYSKVGFGNATPCLLLDDFFGELIAFLLRKNIMQSNFFTRSKGGIKLVENP